MEGSVSSATLMGGYAGRSSTLSSRKSDSLANLSDTARKNMEVAEMTIARFIFMEAVTKLRLVLPTAVVEEVMERKRQKLQAADKFLDSGVLRDVLLQEYRFRSANTIQKPLTKDEAAVKAALDKLFLENVALEMDEETAELGTRMLSLFLEVLDCLPHSSDHSLIFFSQYLQEWETLHGKIEQAEHFGNTQKNAVQDEADATGQYIEEQLQQMESVLEGMKREEAFSESELNDLEARVAVEKEYIEESGRLYCDLQLWKSELAERAALDTEACNTAAMFTTENVYEECRRILDMMAKDIQERKQAMESEFKNAEEYLTAQVRLCQDELTFIQNEIERSQDRTSTMRQDIDRWRKERANELKEKMELAQLWNAVITIQRWWRWQKWRRERFGRKKKRDKGPAKKTGIQKKTL